MLWKGREGFGKLPFLGLVTFPRRPPWVMVRRAVAGEDVGTTHWIGIRQ